MSRRMWLPIWMPWAFEGMPALLEAASRKEVTLKREDHRIGRARTEQWKEVRAVLLRWLLFETKLGETLLAFLERAAGLAVVNAEGLGTQTSQEPR